MSGSDLRHGVTASQGLLGDDSKVDWWDAPCMQHITRCKELTWLSSLPGSRACWTTCERLLLDQKKEQEQQQEQEQEKQRQKLRLWTLLSRIHMLRHAYKVSYSPLLLLRAGEDGSKHAISAGQNLLLRRGRRGNCCSWQAGGKYQETVTLYSSDETVTWVTWDPLPIMLRLRCAMSGTDLVSPQGAQVRYGKAAPGSVLRACYAMSGTDIGYAVAYHAMRALRDVRPCGDPRRFRGEGERERERGREGEREGERTTIVDAEEREREREREREEGGEREGGEATPVEVSAYAHAMSGTGLAYATLGPAYALAMRCPVLAYHMVLPQPTRCPVLA
eukprot:3940429-Rhodomonas_salina.1